MILESRRFLLKALLLSISALFIFSNLQAAVFTSTVNGGWLAAATWSFSGTDSDGIPDADDDVIIAAGTSVTMNGNQGACNSLTINGTATWSAARTTNVGTGGLTLNPGSSTAGNSTGTLNITGNVTIASGGTSSISRLNITVSGTLYVNGQLDVNSANGTKNFQSIVMSSGAVWNSTANETYTINGNLEMNGSTMGGSVNSTFSVAGNMTCTGGTNTVNKGTLNISGLTSVTGTLNFTSTTGTKTFGDFIINSGSTLNCSVAETFTLNGNFTNNGTFNSNTGTYTFAGSSKTINGSSESKFERITVTGSYVNNTTLISVQALSGGGSLTQGTGSTLKISGSFNLTSFDASTNANTVIYNSAGNQTIRAVNYHNLEVNKSAGTATFGGNSTITNNFTVTSGIARITTQAITVSGLTYLSSTLRITSNTGAKNFGDISINSSGNFDVTAAVNITIAGSLTNNGTFTSNSGTYTFTGASKTISGTSTLSIPFLTINGSCTNNGILTVDSALAGTGSLINGNSSSLTLGCAGGSLSISSFNASGTGNTVIYNRSGNQNVIVPSNGSYQDLTITGSGIKTLQGSTNLIGTLTISAGTVDIAGNTLTLVSNSSGTARIATLGSGATISGNIAMQRYVERTGSVPEGFRQLASAVNGATVADWADDFTVTYPDWWSSIYTYDETVTGAASDSDWVGIASAGESLAVGKGYSVYIFDADIAGTITVTGTPNTGDIPLPVTFTSTPHADDGVCLVANPYPSQIDWDDSDWIKTNMNNAIYIWRNDIQQYASYVNGAATLGGSQYIASSQSFFVQANNSSPVLTAREGVKTASVPSFYRMNEAPSNSIKLVLSKSGSSFTDESVIRSLPTASAVFDGSFDAVKFPSSNTQVPYLASAASDNTLLSINTISDFLSSKTIPLAAKGPSGSYSLTADIASLPQGSCIVLEDTKTGSYHSLTSSYSFQVDPADSASVAPRFLLHFTPPVALSLADASCNNSADGSAVATAPAPGTWSFLWKNSAGDTIRFTPASSSGSDAVSALAVGSYSVTASRSSAFCSDFTASFSISQSNPVTPLAAAQNPSCGGNGKDGNIYLSLSGGSAPYTFLWSNGAVSKDLINVPAGVYSVTITDSKGCSASISESLVQPLFVNADFAASEDTLYLSTGTTVSFLNNSSGATSFKWLFGDGDSSELQNPVHTYLSPGSFNASLIASNSSCSDSSFSPITILEKPDGIKDPAYEKEISISQTDSRIIIDFPSNAVASTILLYNMEGKLVFSAATGGNEKKTINMVQYPQGIYFLMISDGIHTFSKKISFRK